MPDQPIVGGDAAIASEMQSIRGRVPVGQNFDSPRTIQALWDEIERLVAVNAELGRQNDEMRTQCEVALANAEVDALLADFTCPICHERLHVNDVTLADKDNHACHQVCKLLADLTACATAATEAYGADLPAKAAGDPVAMVRMALRTMEDRERTVGTLMAWFRKQHGAALGILPSGKVVFLHDPDADVTDQPKFDGLMECLATAKLRSEAS